jgi:hypothetical protein
MREVSPNLEKDQYLEKGLRTITKVMSHRTIEELNDAGERRRIG